MQKFFLRVFLALVAALLTWDAGQFYAAGSTDWMTLVKAFAFAGFAEVAMMLFSKGIFQEERPLVKGVLVMVTAALFLGTNFAAGFEATKALRMMQAKAESQEQLADLLQQHRGEKLAQLQEFGKGNQKLNYAKGVNRLDELFNQEVQLYQTQSPRPMGMEVALFFLVRICLSFTLVYFPGRMSRVNASVKWEGASNQKEVTAKSLDADQQALDTVGCGAVTPEEIPVDLYGDTPALILKNNQLRNVKGRPASMAKLTLLQGEEEMEEGRQYLVIREEKKGLIRRDAERLESYVNKAWKKVAKTNEEMLKASQIYRIEMAS